MTDPREIEALCELLDARDLGMAEGNAMQMRVSHALRALVAQLAAAQTDNTHLRAALAQSKDPCVYCQLPAEEMGRCRSGFPGCARADDMAGCPEFGASLWAHSLREQLAAARADTERLDWLEAREIVSWEPDLTNCMTGTVRAAIDAARGGA